MIEREAPKKLVIHVTRSLRSPHEPPISRTAARMKQTQHSEHLEEYEEWRGKQSWRSMHFHRNTRGAKIGFVLTADCGINDSNARMCDVMCASCSECEIIYGRRVYAWLERKRVWTRASNNGRANMNEHARDTHEKTIE